MHTTEHAQFKGVNLMVGSHTFTEVFGIESLALKLKKSIKELEVVKLNERHYEANVKK